MTVHAAALDAFGVCHAYDGVDVLIDVAAVVRFGEVTAVTGPNGAGKSTLVEVLAGTLHPRAGRVDRSGDLAFVLQRPQVPAALPLTAADVVAMGLWKRGAASRTRAARREAVEDALERVGMCDQRAVALAALSGGQRQRVFLAQGLVRRPDVLLLDEPAAGLDQESRERTDRILREEAARGVAVLHVTHDAAAAAAADHVIRLARGRRIR